MRTNLARIQRNAAADGNEKAAAGVIRNAMEDLPLAPGTDRTLWRLQLLGALNWTPTWYRPDGKSPPAIARALVAALRISATEAS